MRKAGAGTNPADGSGSSRPEARYSLEPADIRDPDRIFDRAWAEGKLRADFARADNLDGYEQLREFLPLGENEIPYPEAARRLGIRKCGLRLQIHRMRKRYARLVEEEIAQTVSAPAEQKHLLTVMGW